MWLLDPDVLAAMDQAYRSGMIPTAQQQAEYESSYTTLSEDGSPRILTIAGGNAEVEVKGVITKSPDFWSMLFGGGNTTYGEIVSALEKADADPKVSSITMAIDSPGGQFDGLFDALAAIQATSKPVKALVSGLGASAAYAIASQADEIVASNRAVRVGSVGVAATIGVRDDTVTITSTKAPKKRPDATTSEGVAMIREDLDALHDIFVESIADGRKVSMTEVNSNFGQGATLLADEALKRGMIDAIAGTTLRSVSATSSTTARSGGSKPRIGIMDLKDLKAQHPDVYAAAVQEGVDQERDRVTAHLTMGEASGDTKTAFAAIKDGSGMTATLQATYMTAGMNRRDIDARQEDDASVITSSADATSVKDNGADEVARLVEERLGAGA